MSSSDDKKTGKRGKAVKKQKGDEGTEDSSDDKKTGKRRKAEAASLIQTPKRESAACSPTRYTSMNSL